MSNAEPVNISVFSRTFTLKSDPAHTAKLKQSAEYLHKKMQLLSRKTGMNEFEDLVVVAALNILAECDDKIRRLAGQENQSVTPTTSIATSVPPAADIDIDQWNNKINQLLATT